MKFSNTIFAAAGLFLVQPFFSDVALAQGTPDDLPPALETWCDQYHGRDYGVCNAYCEAQDCEGPNADKNSCDGLREKFLQSTGETRFPCEVSRCPCWDSIEDISGGTSFAGDVYSTLVGYYSVNFDVGSAAIVLNICLGYNDDGSFSLTGLEEADIVACTNDILTYAAANSGVGNNIKSSCTPYPAPTTTCPCWDGSDTSGSFPIFPGLDGRTIWFSEFRKASSDISAGVWLKNGTSTSSYNTGTAGPGNYICIGYDGNSYKQIASEEFEACYNDLLSWSAYFGENECHAFF
ncbi:unknown protein [Seminavis robusta]|uniref:Uncharacterized protein n=1 Tax=Seminavis robusta TaxID=568900 RepID=A0A9N8H3A0_9STRA|nr:unknown protein [Seminavis robusta]|eukprot:Sro34_g021850.1 n/a (293) ;mRNA; f:23063-23941